MDTVIRVLFVVTLLLIILSFINGITCIPSFFKPITEVPLRCIWFK